MTRPQQELDLYSAVLVLCKGKEVSVGRVRVVGLGFRLYRVQGLGLGGIRESNRVKGRRSKLSPAESAGVGPECPI